MGRLTEVTRTEDGVFGPIRLPLTTKADHRPSKTPSDVGVRSGKYSNGTYYSVAQEPLVETKETAPFLTLNRVSLTLMALFLTYSELNTIEL